MTIQQIIEEQMKEFDKQFMIERITRVLISNEDKYTYVAKPIDLKGHEATEAIKSFLSSYTRKLIEAVGEELIEKDEWEDPDIMGSDQSNGNDFITKPWRRNGLRAEQRLKLKEIISSLK